MRNFCTELIVHLFTTPLLSLYLFQSLSTHFFTHTNTHTDTHFHKANFLTHTHFHTDTAVCIFSHKYTFSRTDKCPLSLTNTHRQATFISTMAE